MKPKEDPADKAARMRERRMSELDQSRSSEATAAGLSTDLRAVYGSRLVGAMTAKKSLK